MPLSRRPFLKTEFSVGRIRRAAGFLPAERAFLKNGIFRLNSSNRLAPTAGGSPPGSPKWGGNRFIQPRHSVPPRLKRGKLKAEISSVMSKLFLTLFKIITLQSFRHGSFRGIHKIDCRASLNSLRIHFCNRNRVCFDGLFLRFLSLIF